MATLSELLEKRKSRGKESEASTSDKSENSYSLSDLLEERKIRKAYEAGRLGVMMSPMLDRIDTYIKNGNTYIGEYYDRYGLDHKTGEPLESEGDGYIYRGDTQDYLDTVTSYRDSMSDEAKQLEWMLGFYKPYLSEEYYNSVTGALSGHGTALSSIVDVATRDHDFYSQFEDEEAYKGYYYNDKYNKLYGSMDVEGYSKAFENVEERYNTAKESYQGVGPSYVPEELEWEYNYLENKKQTAEYLAYDVAEGQQEIDRLGQIIGEYEAIVVPNTAGMGRDREKIQAAIDNYVNSFAALERKYGMTYEEAKTRLFDAQKYHKTAIDYIKRVEYESYRQNEDFDEHSEYDPALTGGIDIDWLKSAIKGMPETQYNGDLLYDIINGNQAADTYDLLNYLSPDNTLGDLAINLVRGDFDASNISDYVTRDSIGGLLSKLALKGGDSYAGLAQHMEEEERQLFNYIYHTQGKEAAHEYYSLLSNRELMTRKLDSLAGDLENVPTALKVAYSLPAGIDQFASGVEGIFKDEYDPSFTSMAGQKIREDLADEAKISWYNARTGSWENGIAIPFYNLKTGSWDSLVSEASAAQMLYDIGNTSANMLPSILVSVAVEAALPTVGEGGVVFAGLTGAQIAAGAGALTTGASAWGNAKQEMLSMGYSVDQANAYGLMVGASEAGLSYLLSGIPGLRGGDGVFSALGQKVIGKVDNALAKAAIALGGNMLDEGLEEGLQTVLEGWFKEIATGVDFEDPSAEEILYSSLLGALTAAGFGGGKLAIDTGVNAINTSKVGKGFMNSHGQSGVGALAAQGLGLNQNTAAYKQAGKIQTKLDAGKSASNYSVGKLLSSMSESQTSTAVQTRLSAHIENKNDVRKLSNTITDILFGREVSDKALSAVADNKYALNTLNDVLGAKLKKGATVSDVKAAVKSYQTATTSKSGANASTNAKQGSEVKNSGRGGATFSVQENADGRFDVIAEASGNSGSIASYETRNQAQAAAYGYTLGMGAEGLYGLVNLSENLPDGVDLGEAALAFNAIYSQGRKGKAFSAVKFGELLSIDQRQYAYNLGIMDKALDSARAKNVAAEISGENSGKVLQKDGVGDKIEESNDAIWQYKSSESYKINEAIRSGRELTEEESAFIEELDRELEKTPKYSGVVYRNMSFDLQGKEALDEFVAQHAEGSIITYDAYTSTSKVKDGYVVDGDLLVHIEIDGENGNDVSRGYGLEEEQEVLFGRETDFLIKSVSYDGKTANIVMEEFTNGERAIQRGIEGNKPTQQGYDSESNSSEMQRLQKTLPEKSDDNMQNLSRGHTARDTKQQNNLSPIRKEINSLTENDNGHQEIQGESGVYSDNGVRVRGEVNDTDPDVQQAKENGIEPERVVYSSEKAMAYDAVSEDKLSEDQKKAVNVGKDIGRKVVIADTRTADGVPVDGFLGNDGVIYISKNNKSPVAFIFKHELAHFCERAGQKYQDFKNAVRKSATFKSWLKKKGYNSAAEYNSQIRKERSEVGIDPGELGANNEIIANFVADMMFGDDTSIADRLIGELKPKQKRSVREFLRDFFEWIKGRFTGKGNTARTEIHRLEKMFGKAFRTAVKVEQGSGEQFAFNDSFGQQLKDWQAGNGKANGIYNGKYFRLGTTPDVLTKHGAPAGEVIMFEDCLLKITGLKHSISLDELAKIPSQLNDPILLFKGSVENSFVALTEIKDKLGNDVIVAIHINKKMGRSVINKITSVYSKTDDFGNNKINNYVTDQIKKGNLLDASTKKAPNWFTTSGLQLPHVVQTILDANNSISQKTEKSTQNSKKFSEDSSESFSYNPQNDKIDDVVGRYENGEITIDELKRLLKKPEADNPVSIANMKPEDMNTTPSVNKKTTGQVGDGDSKFADSVKKSKIFDEKFKAEVGDDNFVKHYRTITNKETLAEAAKLLDEGGEGYVNKWLAQDEKRMGAVDTAVGFILLKRYQDIGDYTSAAAVARKIRKLGTIAGHNVQIFSIIGRFDADMMQAYAQKELDEALEKAQQVKSSAWVEKNKERFKLTDEEILFIRDNILYAAKCPDGSRDRAIALAEICTLIQNKLPAKKGQWLRAWQRNSMLLNPKTLIRNLTGNGIMVPVFIMSDWFATPIDWLASKKTGIRTTGVSAGGAKEAFKGFVKGGKESADDYRRKINTRIADLDRFKIGEGKSYDENTRFKALNAVAHALNEVDRFTSVCVDWGDRTFYEAWFSRSLENQMKLNGVNQPTEAMIEIAAIEALERTWQDNNGMTQFVTNIKNGMNRLSVGGYGLGDVVIKFAKTPANLTKAIYDYSPAALISIGKVYRQYNRACKEGTVTPALQKRFVSTVGKALSGTMVYLVAAALFELGMLSGAGDEDDDTAAYERYIQGKPSYSIKIGDKWFSYDWAQPLGAAIAIVADFMESREEGEDLITGAVRAIKTGGDVLFDQSFMASFKDVFSSGDPLSGIVVLLLNDLSSLVPTVFSQTANLFDDKRRVTYDSTSEFNTAFNRVLVKIPGLRNTLEADVDVFGREIPNSQHDIWNAFFNPGNTYTDTSDEATNHVYEIYKSTGDKSAFPKKAEYSVTIKGKDIKLNTAARAEYQTTMGEISHEMIEALLENDVYNNLGDSDKLFVLNRVYEYAAKAAKCEVDGVYSYEVFSKIRPYVSEEEYNDMTEEERMAVIDNEIFGSDIQIRDLSDEGIANYLVNAKLPAVISGLLTKGDVDKAVELIGGIDASVSTYGFDEDSANQEIKDTKSKIKTAVTSYWKWAYGWANEKGDKAEMENIEEMLIDIGIYGNKSEVRKKLKEWLKEYDTKN